MRNSTAIVVMGEGGIKVRAGFGGEREGWIDGSLGWWWLMF